MDVMALWSGLGSASFDDVLVWGVAVLAGLVALIALVNALDMFMDAEAG